MYKASKIGVFNEVNADKRSVDYYSINGSTVSVNNPIDITTVLTDKCNLKCRFCIAAYKAPRPEATITEMRVALEAMFKHFHIDNILTLGGEATYSSKFIEWLGVVGKYKNSVRDLILTTNGTRLEDEKFLKIVADSPLTSLNLSYHHYDKAANDALSRGKTLTVDQIAKIHKVLSSNGKSLRLNVVSQKGGIDTAEKLARYAETFAGRVDMIKITQMQKTAQYDVMTGGYTSENFVKTEIYNSMLDEYGAGCPVVAQNNNVFSIEGLKMKIVDHGGQKVMLVYAQDENSKAYVPDIEDLKIHPDASVTNSWKQSNLNYAKSEITKIS